MRAIVPRYEELYSYAGAGYANPHAATSVGGATLTYDNNGNVTAIGSLDYTWDWRNRLASAERTGGGITSYGYDHTGQRMFKATGTATTSYPNRYFNLATTTGAATTTKHIFSPGGELLATVVGASTTATTTYLHPDHLGGTNVATDEDGEVTQTLDYYPYGSQRIATGIFAEQRRFIGEEFDKDTEFSYLNARYYQGSRGQFMSQDPAVVTFDGKDNQLLLDPQQLNSYSYARNNPLILLDASGERVYLAASVVVPISPPPGFLDDSYHLYYYIAPDLPYRITESIASGQGPFTLGAGPQGPFTSGSLLPRLGTADAPNNDFASGLPPGRFVEITPNGQTEEELINGLLHGYTSIGQGIDYRAFANQTGRYNGNSNNFAATLAQSAGIQNQFNNFTQNLYAPGKNRGAPTAASSASYRSASAFGFSGESKIGLGNIGAFASFVSQFIN